MSRVRRICVITGTRAEYGMLRSLLRAINAHRRLTSQLVVTGTHLLRAFGATAREITRDGFEIAAKVRLQQGGDDASREAEGVGRAVAGLARAMRRLDPDVVVVLGDRVEAMAGALAATCSRRILAHIHGGDVAPGDIDDGLRHAITKLAHVHFPATRDAARRIARLGEDPERIHVVGSPALDELRALSPPSADWLVQRLRLPRAVADASQVRYALVVQHPIGDASRVERQRMETTLEVAEASGLWPVVIYPNSDPGYSGIVAAIEARKRRPGVSVFRSLPRTDYLRALIGARVLVGNSSSGIIESATAGTPAVNIGPRQAGRRRCGPAVLDCSHARSAIRRSIQKARILRPRRGSRGAYGDGRAGERMATLLDELELGDSLRRKRIRY